MGARTGMGTLAAHRQAAAVPKPAIVAGIHEPLDVHGDITAEVALDHVVAIDHFTGREDLGVCQLVDPAAFGMLTFVMIRGPSSIRCRG